MCARYADTYICPTKHMATKKSSATMLDISPTLECFFQVNFTRFNAQISYASCSHSLCKYLNLAQVNLNSVISQCRIECVQQTLMRFQSHYRFLPFLYLFIFFLP